jgi:hypothetical protein
MQQHCVSNCLYKTGTWHGNKRFKIYRLASDTRSLQDALFTLNFDELMIREYIIKEILLRAVS